MNLSPRGYPARAVNWGANAPLLFSKAKMNTNGTEPNNPGTKKPFKDTKTGEIVYRFRGRAGFVPVEQSNETMPPSTQVNRNKNNNNGISELIAIAINTLKTLELTLEQIKDRYHG